ncbi:ParB N-terminal domain-containing protein [Bradyrhizobium sp. 23AC]
MRHNKTPQNTAAIPTETEKTSRWDVIKIADIAIRDDWQVRAKIDPTTVRRYQAVYKNEGKLPPIEIAMVDGVLRLVDGWHRVKALQLLERDSVEANITEMSMSEARWAAASANLAHGLPLKPKEVRNVFKAYITARRHYRSNGRLKSYREMASELNGAVSYRTLNRWMELDHPKIAKEMSVQHGGENKDQYHDGKPPQPSEIGPLQLAAMSLDNALAEARGMSSEDRRALLDYARRLLTRLESLPQWTAEERENGLHAMPANNDF